MSDYESPDNGIYLALSASKARYKSYLSAQDAGFNHITMRDIRVRRAPEFDRMDPRQSGWRECCIDPTPIGSADDED